jgi:hypothetical protein
MKIIIISMQNEIHPADCESSGGSTSMGGYLPMLRQSAKPSNNGLRSHVSVWTTARGLLTSSPSPCPARSSSSLPNTWLIDRMHHVCQLKEEEQDTFHNENYTSAAWPAVLDYAGRAAGHIDPGSCSLQLAEKLKWLVMNNRCFPHGTDIYTS